MRIKKSFTPNLRGRTTRKRVKEIRKYVIIGKD